MTYLIEKLNWQSKEEYHSHSLNSELQAGIKPKRTHTLGREVIFSEVVVYLYLCYHLFY